MLKASTFSEDSRNLRICDEVFTSADCSYSIGLMVETFYDVDSRQLVSAIYRVLTRSGIPTYRPKQDVLLIDNKEVLRYSVKALNSFHEKNIGALDSEDFKHWAMAIADTEAVSA